MNIVIARFKENIDWVFARHFTASYIYDKSGSSDSYSKPLINIGREANTFLFHVVRSYKYLEGDTVFCQGNPFAHEPHFIEKLNDPECRFYGGISGCPSSGYPHMDDAYLDEHCRVLGLPIQAEYRFSMGAQYRVSAEQIHARPVEFYECLLALTKLMPRLPYCLERLWPIIWGIELP